MSNPLATTDASAFGPAYEFDGCRAGASEAARPSTSPAVRLAELAVQSIIDEADLTPKPGLVDRRGAGAHADLDLALMHRSARSLFPCFQAIAEISAGAVPSAELRLRLAEIGRDGERAMFAATGGVNSHKGAIWAHGLLIAGAAMSENSANSFQVAGLARGIAEFSDPAEPKGETHGLRVAKRYGVVGARGEARNGFPHVVDIGLPALRNARERGLSETHARLDALLAMMAQLDDTCLLHRGGLQMLQAAKIGASRVLSKGGSSTSAGFQELMRLDAKFLKMNASPGGSGDLLAAVIFMDSIAKL